MSIPSANHLAELQEQNAFLLAENASLKDALVEPAAFPAVLRLTKSERRLLGHFLARQLVTKDSAMDALYFHKSDYAETNTPAVFVSRIRKKLAPVCVTIETDWGNGWHMSADSKAALREMCVGDVSV